jgi:hypothetical protein
LLEASFAVINIEWFKLKIRPEIRLVLHLKCPLFLLAISGISKGTKILVPLSSIKIIFKKNQKAFSAVGLFTDRREE